MCFSLFTPALFCSSFSSFFLTLTFYEVVIECSTHPCLVMIAIGHATAEACTTVCECCFGRALGSRVWRWQADCSPSEQRVQVASVFSMMSQPTGTKAAEQGRKLNFAAMHCATFPLPPSFQKQFAAANITFTPT